MAYTYRVRNNTGEILGDNLTSKDAEELALASARTSAVTTEIYREGSGRLVSWYDSHGNKCRILR